MSLSDRVETLVVWSSFFAISMFVLTIVSIVTMVSYLVWEEVEAWTSVGACMVVMFILMILLCATSIPTAMRVAKETGSKKSLRALYIYLLIPVVIISVMVGNSATFFLNVLIFGWPLFLISGILVVIAANWMSVEVKSLSFRVRCGFCKVDFDMIMDDLVGVCSHCGAANWNPFKPTERKEAQSAIKAYQPGLPTGPRTFDLSGSKTERDLSVTAIIFLTVGSILFITGGVILLIEFWGWIESLLGLIFIGGGIFGLFGSFLLHKRTHYIVPVAASTILLMFSFGAFLVIDICGIALGGFAFVTLFLSIQLWISRKRGRKIKVPVGTKVDVDIINARQW